MGDSSGALVRFPIITPKVLGSIPVFFLINLRKIRISKTETKFGQFGILVVKNIQDRARDDRKILIFRKERLSVGVYKYCIVMGA